MGQKDDELIASALKLVAPGTKLREAIESIQAARAGALIVIGDTDRVEPLSDGGFAIDTLFEAERLFELSKMDGAIILDGDCERILRANVHLVPDATLPTSETGIRHRTADRVSRQTDALVIAISKRRLMVTMYRAGRKLVLEEIETVLAKANQALQTLQRYRSGLDEASERLTTLEFDDMVTLSVVITVIQRSVAAIRVASEIGRYVSELGTEGRLVRMQSDELMLGVEDEYAMLLRDFSHETGPRKIGSIRSQIAGLPQDQFLDGNAIAQILGYPLSAEVLETHVRSRGYRVLNRVPLLPTSVIDRIVDRYGELHAVVRASEDELDEVDGVGERRARAIKEGLRRIREHGAL